MQHKPFILIDGSSYLYRAFHALPPLTNSQGQPTGAIYGVLNMIRKLINDYQPELIGVVFDAKGKSFRNDLYPEYKSNRRAMPDELRQQIKPLFEIIRAMGLPLIIIDNVEADDVIGTLAKQAIEQGLETLISTGDKDMAQLVSDQVVLINTMNNSFLDPQTVVQKFGISPERIVDYLSLVGDSSDNIPGIPNVGPKTAAKWLQEYGTLDAIIANADKITGKVGDNLRNNLGLFPLSKQLLTIKTDVELTVTPQTLKPLSPDEETLIRWYRELEFKTWLAEALSKTTVNEATSKKHYEIILDKTAFNRWLTDLIAAEYFAFDTETTSLDYMQAQLVGVSFAIAPHKAAYVPFGHDYPGAPLQLARDWVLEQLKPLLENPKYKKVGHNLKYDMEVLANHHIALQGVDHDTMLESYVLNSTASRHNLDTLALKYLGHGTILFEEVAGKGIKQLTFNQVAVEQAGPYAAEDADVALQLHQMLWPKIAAIPGLKKTYSSIELPLLNVLAAIERNGVLVDAAQLRQQSSSLATRLGELKVEIFNLAGEEFNIDSPKQLQEILFNKLLLPITKKTPTGQPSTAEAVLQELAIRYQLPRFILEYRSLTKLKSTYTDKLPQAINPTTQRVHTSYNQALTATGRLSSSEPNLQNIPIRTEEGRRIRQAFTVPPGYKMLTADYSQIELRIMAHLSQDSGLLHAFQHGLDIHQATAAEVFNVPLEEVTPLQRRNAKAVNFGLIYGMSSFGLAQQIGVSRLEAQDYIDRYFRRYPGVEKYMNDTRRHAHQLGYVETLLGRRLYLPEINASNMMRQKAAERTAINAPMQGTAADIIKLAMIKVFNSLQASPLDIKMVMQVHDELVFEIKETQVEEASALIKKDMESAAQLAVPLLVSIGVGDNWDEAH